METTTSPSDRADIYMMTVLVAFKRNRRVIERVIHITSVYDNPRDIMKYGHHTMNTIQRKIYGKSKASQQVLIREILTKDYMTKSQCTLQEHKQIACG
jgi:hypothetical protein